jgi:hypothetical protein
VEERAKRHLWPRVGSPVALHRPPCRRTRGP